ncbi:scarecrow-like protein 32 isoform X2 [Physcomitrium patens]|nr:scarecrow-like protein 32 isoform X2 [Physcomitrium patens]|eukprot:XP_024397580.1 scarecrow-like protein 32 isoform X2 [Physcomitrella patens]
MNNFSQQRQLSIGSVTTESSEMSNFVVEGMTPEQLLVICATAIKQNDSSVVEKAVSALKKVSSIQGEPSERATAYFLKALLLRRSSMPDVSNFTSSSETTNSDEVQWTERRYSLTELTRLVDLTPYFRFGYTASNGALLEAFEGVEQIHILDFSTTHGMQWPTFIEALSDREHGPPSSFRLTLLSSSVPFPPRLQTTYEEVGQRLSKYARLRNIPFDFDVLSQPLANLSSSDLRLREEEVLGVNLSLRIHHLSEESTDESSPRESQQYGAPQSLCPGDKFLYLIRCLNPTVVTLYEEDCDTSSSCFVKRVEQSYAYEWMPFDFLATIWPSENSERQEHEKNVGKKIENIVACEGLNRLNRLESKKQWLRRMNKLRFRIQPVREDVKSQLQDVVDHHNTGWGMKNDEETNTQSLLWKGNPLTFSSSWVPAP